MEKLQKNPSKLIVMWLWGAGLECAIEASKTAGFHSICIDKEPEIESILRLVLDHKGIIPTQDMLIHGWKADKYLFFLDQSQHEELTKRYITACIL